MEHIFTHSFRSHPDASMNKELTAIIFARSCGYNDRFHRHIGADGFLPCERDRGAMGLHRLSAGTGHRHPAIGWAEERFGGRRCWMTGLLLFLAVLGGIVLSITSWHWLFLINIPVGLIAIFISAR